MITGTKSLLIEGLHNLRYIHVFVGGVLDLNNNPEIDAGGCTLKYMDGMNNDYWAIIIRDNGIYTIKDGMIVDTTFIVTCDPENCSTKWDMRVNLDVDVY